MIIDHLIFIVLSLIIIYVGHEASVIDAGRLASTWSHEYLAARIHASSLCAMQCQ